MIALGLALLTSGLPGPGWAQQPAVDPPSSATPATGTPPTDDPGAAAPAAGPPLTEPPAAAAAARRGSAAEDGAEEREERSAAFDPEKARRYRAMLEQNPELGAVYRKLVELYGRKQGIGELVEDYRRRVQSKPGSYADHMVLGHLLRTIDQDQAALAEYETAARLKPNAALPLLAAAALAEADQQFELARTRYEQALARLGGVEEKRRVLERMADMAFRNQDFKAAGQRLEALQRLDPADERLAGEVARIWERNGRPAEALASWQGVLAKVRGNAPETVRVLKEIAQLQFTLGQDQEAEASLRRALGLVRPGNWNVPELHARLVEIYRRRDQLRALIEEFEASWTNKEFGDWMLLAALHDEVGQEAEAMNAYRAAARLRPREAEPRRKLIAIHERQGELDAVVAEYRQLMAALPEEYRYGLELAAVHRRRGDVAAANSLLEELARRGAGKPEMLAAVAEAFVRHGNRERALALTEKLAAADPASEAHLISLGEQQYQMGRVDQALETWRKILEVVPEPARAWAVYGETLASHDRLDAAIEALSKAVQLAPEDLRHRRSLAGLLRRAEKLTPARQLWQEILARSATERQRSEAREQVVGLSLELEDLEAMVAQWRRQWQGPPSDPGAGLLVGQGLMKLKKWGDAEQVWQELLRSQPGDVEALLGLETCYARQYRLDQAIAVLEKVAPLVPHRARELYQRMAEYAIKLFRDDEAVRWSARAVALNPEDAGAHARLAEIYFRKQDLPRAVASYQRAIQLDPKDFKSYFRLAEIDLDLGRSAEADSLYRQVLRLATTENDLRQAARLAMQLDMALGTMETLERELLPLLFRVPASPIYLQTLVELYGRMARPLQNQLRYGRADEVAEARRALAAIGGRAARPLLEALAGGDALLTAQALSTLTLLGTPVATLPLGHLLDAKELPLRVRTAVALGRIGDARAVPSLVRALEDPQREGREAACWALGRVGTPEAVRALIRVLERKEPRAGVRAVALIGLGRSKQPALARPWVLRELGDAKELPRAAAAWAAGRLPRDAELVRALTAALERDSLLVRQAAAVSLAALGGAEEKQALLLTLWGDEPSLRQLAAQLVLQPPSSTVDSSPFEESLGFLETEQGTIQSEALVESLVRPAPALPGRENGGPGRPSLTTIGREPLARALAKALATSGPRRLATLLDLDGRQTGLGLGPLTPAAGDAAGRARLEEALAGSLRTVRELATGEPAETAALALSLLGKLGDASSAELVEQALGHGEAAVREAAARSAGLLGLSQTAARLLELLAKDPDAGVRAAAAASCGLLPTAVDGAPLVAALNDPHALVRAASARSLGLLRSPPAGPALATALIGLLHDPIPTVRAAAAASLGRLKVRDAAEALRSLDGDHHPDVRQAAREALTSVPR